MRLAGASSRTPTCRHRLERCSSAPSSGRRAARREFTALVRHVIDRWDGAQAARQVELFAGRDLQFIRINGTVVGSLAGIAIHAVSLLLG